MGIMDRLSLPPELVGREQWVVWRYHCGNRDCNVEVSVDSTECSACGNEDKTKVPYRPYNTTRRAKSSDSETWGSYEDAERVAERNKEFEVGFVFSDDDNIIGVDLDHVRDLDTGEVEQWAQDVINRLDSFTEVSPSGTGFHILVRGDMPDGRKRSGDIEMYDSGRFFTVTKNRVPNTPYRVRERSGPIKVVHHKYLKREDAEEENTPSPSPGSIDMDDKEIIEKAKESRNGDKFKRLWNGDTSGYKSQSEADAALCSILAFWTRGDVEKVYELFKKSELYRPKWDDVHGDQTYGEMTAEYGVEECSNYYSGGN